MKKHVKILRFLQPVVDCKTFDDYIDLSHVPATEGMIVLCRNEGYGLVPITLLLPHQVYTTKLKSYLQQYPDTQEFAVFYVTNYTPIAKVDCETIEVDEYPKLNH